VRILLAGVLAGVPGQGGASWAVLQYRHGFAALGHDVLFVEPAPARPDVLAYFDRVVAAEGLAGRAALLHPGRCATGVDYRDIARFAAGADVLVNLAGALTDPELTGPVHRRIYVDLDPVFTQLWQAQGVDMGLAGHDVHFTVGPALGTSACPVPGGGVEWRPTVPPVVLDRWRYAVEPARQGWTTVGHWRSYGPVVHDGVFYGQKAHSVRKLLALPELLAPLGARFEPALALHPGEDADVAALAAHGWRRLDPAVVAADPERYHEFVTGSLGEIAIAKAGYVTARCGWFSDRSACYLAAGRPVVAQDTGWSRFLPAGEGLLRFDGAAEAADAVGEVAGNYGRHRKAARALAEDALDARLVLPRLLDAGVRTGGPRP
jgi:hypothetical protein